MDRTTAVARDGRGESAVKASAQSHPPSPPPSAARDARAIHLPRNGGRGKALIVFFFAIFGVAASLAAADTANPPDLSRYQAVSPEVDA
ncbi:MAG TPA: hypothetical protein VHU87_05690, partial [Rhizomicrobium sp.]|nr:hypothetical protein [Rhizomicrobium sp.]